MRLAWARYLARGRRDRLVEVRRPAPEVREHPLRDREIRVDGVPVVAVGALPELRADLLDPGLHERLGLEAELASDLLEGDGVVPQVLRGQLDHLDPARARHALLDQPGELADRHVQPAVAHVEDLSRMRSGAASSTATTTRARSRTCTKGRPRPGPMSVIRPSVTAWAGNRFRT